MLKREREKGSERGRDRQACRAGDERKSVKVMYRKRNIVLEGCVYIYG